MIITCATCGDRTPLGECRHCGADPASLDPLECPRCKGYGWYEVVDSSGWYDQTTIPRDCEYCAGRGEVEPPYALEHQLSYTEALLSQRQRAGSLEPRP